MNSGSGDQASELAVRRKRLYFQAQHRGCREADIIIGSFAEREINQLDLQELDHLEAILEADDGEVLNWLLGRVAVPAGYSSALIARMVAAKPS